jgi:hypothetical protein
VLQRQPQERVTQSENMEGSYGTLAASRI